MQGLANPLLNLNMQMALAMAKQQMLGQGLKPGAVKPNFLKPMPFLPQQGLKRSAPTGPLNLPSVPAKKVLNLPLNNMLANISKDKKKSAEQSASRKRETTDEPAAKR